MGSQKVILFSAIVVGFILRMVNINQSFWLDEAAQMLESLRPLKEQFDLSADFHPPLYHLLLHFWLYLGKSEIFARLPSVILGVASIFVIYKIAKILKFNQASSAVAVLLAVSPYHIYYSQEVRPYMLFLFLSALSIYFWLKKDTLKYILINILLLYTNYFASFLLFAQFFTTLLLNKKRLKSELRSLIISFLFMIPWLPKLLRQIEVGFGGGFVGWTQVVSESTWRNIPLTFAKFILGKASFDNNLLYASVLLPAVLIFLVSCFVIRKNKQGQLLLSLFFSSFLSTILVSLFAPLTAPQRLIFLLPLFLLIISSSVNFLSGKIFVLNYSLVLATNLLGLYLYYVNPSFQRENWRQSVSFINSRAPSNHLVLFAFPEPFAPFLWYNRGQLSATGVAENFRVDDKMLSKLRREIEDKDKIYYYAYLSELTDPEKKIRQVIKNSNFALVQILNYPGVGFVYDYDKKIDN